MLQTVPAVIWTIKKPLSEGLFYLDFYPRKLILRSKPTYSYQGILRNDIIATISDYPLSAIPCLA